MHYDANVQRKKLGWEPTLGTWQFRWSAVCRLLHIAPGGVEEYYYYCLPHIIAAGSGGCWGILFLLPHYAPGGTTATTTAFLTLHHQVLRNGFQGGDQLIKACTCVRLHFPTRRPLRWDCPSLGQQEGILLNCGLLALGLVLQNCNCHCPGSTGRAVRHNRM